MPVATRDEELHAVRRRGFGVAYRMLGTVAEAEDVAQEAALRFAGSKERIDEPQAWVTTVATRLALDLLRSARVRREAYVGPWLPEPLVEDYAEIPDAHAELADSLSQAFLVLLERLTPVERAAFLLREVFDYDYARVAEVIDRSEANCRQIVTRARKHIDAARPRFDPDPAVRQRLLERFLAATEAGDVEALEEILAEDAVCYSDGGGKVVAARRPFVGANRIARVFVKFASKLPRNGPMDLELVAVNGQPGRILRKKRDGTIWDVLTVDVTDGRIAAIRVVRNPDKLAHLQLSRSAGPPRQQGIPRSIKEKPWAGQAARQGPHAARRWPGPPSV
jgi:RNA polymerase sigma-70 factor (ECF subfamily)